MFPVLFELPWTQYPGQLKKSAIEKILKSEI